MLLNWVETSKTALAHNTRVFRSIVGPEKILAPAVKGNAYGHGLLECAQVFLENGADFFCVNALYEAQKLRQAGVQIPILLIGYVPLDELALAADLDCHLTVYNEQTIEALGQIKKPCQIHLKIETGNHRQGITLEDLPKRIEQIKKYSHLKLVGASTHFADLEDRLDHAYALKQLSLFEQGLQIIKEAGIELLYKHCANSAAALILPEAHFNFARVGVSMYGLWPSEKTKVAAERLGLNIKLQPVLAWKTRVAQVKSVKKGDFIGYGCTYQMPHDGRLAILPTGYYDGYVRLLGNKSAVLIKGQRAPVVGRIFMNMTAVDITKILGVELEEEVVLLGRQGKGEISAEELAEWSETINYEVTTRINERIPRIIITND